MTEFVAQVISGPRHVLAEGPVWNGISHTVIWVDIVRGSVFEGALDGITLTVLSEHRLDGTVGAAVPGPDGSLLVAAQDRLVVIAADGLRSDGPTVIAPEILSRTNDGAVDPAGRFLIGTMASDGTKGGDELILVEEDGALRLIDSDLSISNGIAWSPDGHTLYNADTLAGTIWARDYEPRTGLTGPRRIQFSVDGFPDGICVDARGRIWVAVWGSGEARCFDLEGTIVDVVEVDAPHVSSVCFVGDALDRLLVTTASRDLSEQGLAQYPNAGRLFIADVPVPGIPTSPWSGSWWSQAEAGSFS